MDSYLYVGGRHPTFDNNIHAAESETRITLPSVRRYVIRDEKTSGSVTTDVNDVHPPKVLEFRIEKILERRRLPFPRDVELSMRKGERRDV